MRRCFSILSALIFILGGKAFSEESPSEEQQAIGTLIDTQKAAMDSLKAQVMESSSVCQQAYAGE